MYIKLSFISPEFPSSLALVYTTLTIINIEELPSHILELDYRSTLVRGVEFLG